MSLERMSAAKLWLTAASGGDAAYLSSALYAMPTLLTDGVPTIEADERWQVYANPEWLSVTEIPVLAGHLGHLVWHLLRDHAGRARSLGIGTQEAAAWATAADLTVAQALAAGGLARVVPTPPGFPPNLSVEEYYLLVERHAAAASCDCGSAADGLPRSYETGPGISTVSGDALRQQVAIEFRGHMSGRGNTPGEWARWVEQVLEPKVPWQQVLSASVRRAVAWTHGSTHPTYRRLSRRQVGHVVLPGYQRPLPAVAVVVDTSGSMDDGLLAQAVGEVDGVLQSMALGDVRVYSCDAAAVEAGRVRRARDLQLVGGGGTDLRVGISLALEARPRPEIVIVLTDGETPWPTAPPPGCVVVAVVITRGAAPRCPEWVQRVDCDVA